MKSRLFVFVLLSCIFCAPMTTASPISLLQSAGGFGVSLLVVLPYIGDNIAYRHGLHFCQEVYPYRNQNKV